MSCPAIVGFTGDTSISTGPGRRDIIRKSAAFSRRSGPRTSRRHGGRVIRLWLAALTYDQQFVAADTMPLSIATLAAYVGHHARIPLELRLFKYPDSLIR